MVVRYANGVPVVDENEFFRLSGQTRVLPPVSKAQAELIWNRASQRYAENVSGEITLFVHKSEGTRTFYQHEFPFLQKNKNIHRWSYKE